MSLVFGQFVKNPDDSGRAATWCVASEPSVEVWLSGEDAPRWAAVEAVKTVSEETAEVDQVIRYAGKLGVVLCSTPHVMLVSIELAEASWVAVDQIEA